MYYSSWEYFARRIITSTIGIGTLIALDWVTELSNIIYWNAFSHLVVSSYSALLCGILVGLARLKMLDMQKNAAYDHA